MTQWDFCSVGFTDNSSEVDEDKSDNKDNGTVGAKEVDAAVPKFPVTDPKDAGIQKQGDFPEAKHLSDPVPERKDSETAKEVDAAVESLVLEIKGQSEQMQKEEN